MAFPHDDTQSWNNILSMTLEPHQCQRVFCVELLHQMHTTPQDVILVFRCIMNLKPWELRIPAQEHKFTCHTCVGGRSGFTSCIETPTGLMVLLWREKIHQYHETSLKLPSTGVFNIYETQERKRSNQWHWVENTCSQYWLQAGSNRCLVNVAWIEIITFCIISHYKIKPTG